MAENKEETRKKLVESFRNQTKLSIIIILFQKGKLTATQMSKIIGTSRSNLYQNLKEMVEDGILAEPESRVRKNYVEKYYYPNTEIFERFSIEDQERALNDKTPGELREYILSALNSQILRLQIIAREIEMMPRKESERLLDMNFYDQILFSNSWIKKEKYETVVKQIREIVYKTLDEEDVETENHAEEGKYNLILIGIPKI